MCICTVTNWVRGLGFFSLSPSKPNALFQQIQSRCCDANCVYAVVPNALLGIAGFLQCLAPNSALGFPNCSALVGSGGARHWRRGRGTWHWGLGISRHWVICGLLGIGALVLGNRHSRGGSGRLWGSSGRGSGLACTYAFFSSGAALGLGSKEDHCGHKSEKD